MRNGLAKRECRAEGLDTNDSHVRCRKIVDMAVRKDRGPSTLRLLCSIVILFNGLIAGTGYHAAIARTDDRGPTGTVMAIRHDIPLLLASQLGPDRSKLIVDWVVADNGEAVVAWHVAGDRGVVVLRFRSGSWWWCAAAVTTPDAAGYWTPMRTPGEEVGACFADSPGPPSAHDLVMEGFIGKSLAADLSNRLKAAAPRPFVYHECFPNAHYYEDTGVSYDARFFDKELLPVRPVLTGRVPENWRKPGARGANVYYVFTLSGSESTPLLFRTDSATFRIWFPYVLPLQTRFTLSIHKVNPEVRAVPGNLKDNVMHFDFPAFTLPPGSVVHGEINGEVLVP
jgi:hypothetical protein